MSALFNTTSIRRSNGRVSAFEYAIEDLRQLTFPVARGETRSLQHFLDSTYTDAFIVVQDGIVIAEQYFNGMGAETPHLLNSVSKSFVGMLAGIAVDDGLLNTGSLVSDYLHKLANSAFRETTVQAALDMTAGVATPRTMIDARMIFGMKPPWWDGVPIYKPTPRHARYLRTANSAIRTNNKKTNTFTIEQSSPTCAPR